ncbi:sugar/nucleoside kinase (ribokinase family) [Bradyrhizobium sp. GM6.1]
MSGPTDGLSPADVDAAADAIRTSRVFVTQLEQPVAAAQLGLEIARAADSITVFNPRTRGRIRRQPVCLMRLRRSERD